MSIFRVTTTRHVLDGRRVPAETPGAQKVVSRSKKWYGYVGKSKVPLHANRAVAMKMLVDLRQSGDPDSPARRRREEARPLESAGDEEGHLELFRQHIASSRKGKGGRPVSTRYVLCVLSRVRLGLAGCRMPRDIDRGETERRLAGLLADREPVPVPNQPTFRLGEICELFGITKDTAMVAVQTYGLPFTGSPGHRKYGREGVIALASIRARGLAPSYVATVAWQVRRFSRWLTKRCRWPQDPLDGLEVSCPAGVGRRHERRPLTGAEISLLLDVVPSSRRLFRGLSGRDRWAIYLTALSTGFRREELSGLTPSRFDLDADPPSIYLSDAESKNGRGAPQPVPRASADALADYLHGRDPRCLVWPGTWWHDAAEMLRRDLREAGIAYAREGPEGLLWADFHALRHTFVALLDRAGVTLKQAMQLARHSTPGLTLRVYGRAQVRELGDAVGRVRLPTWLPTEPVKDEEK